MSLSRYRRPLWRYPLFQIPLLLLGACLAAALLFWLLGLGRVPVAVAIALDLSSSTYSSEFNAPGSIMAQEVQAVQAYLQKNSSGILRQPNQVQVFGFASGVKPLTLSFDSDSTKVAQELSQALSSNLPNIIGGGTNLDLAIQEASQALATTDRRCRELLVVTDGVVEIAPSVISRARERSVRINAIVLGTDSPDLQRASWLTRGTYLTGDVNSLEQLFTEKLFARFNSNWRWILLWLGLGWIALMWLLVMPLDRWIFQGLLKMRFDFAGRLALFNAFFWTVATPAIFWGIYRLLNLAFPFISEC